MKIVTDEEGEKEVYIKEDEYRAYQIIKLGRDLGLPPNVTFKELKENNLHGAEMRAGMSAYNMSKKGAKIYKDYE